MDEFFLLININQETLSAFLDLSVKDNELFAFFGGIKAPCVVCLALDKFFLAIVAK